MTARTRKIRSTAKPRIGKYLILGTILFTLAFIAAFAVTSVALSFLRFTNQDVMMNAAELGWYYILYLFASIMVVLGVINLWMFRRPLWDILVGRDGDDDDDDI